jgi:energy-converting hydrogenase Eha subunit G
MARIYETITILKQEVEQMKEYEYIGVMSAVVAYLMIVTGNLSTGFMLGAVASFSLLIYFITIKSWPSMGLQSFFICANIYGLSNIGII